MKTKVITEKQFRKIIEDVRKDTLNDNFELDQVAYDLAENLYYDTDLRIYAEKCLGTKDKRSVVTFLAESI